MLTPTAEVLAGVETFGQLQQMVKILVLVLEV